MTSSELGNWEDELRQAVRRASSGPADAASNRTNVLASSDDRDGLGERLPDARAAGQAAVGAVFVLLEL